MGYFNAQAVNNSTTTTATQEKPPKCVHNNGGALCESNYMDDDRANFDDVAWDRNDEAWEESKISFQCVSIIRKIESFVTQKFGKTATWVTPMWVGGYNNIYRVRIEGSDDVVIRLPQPSLAQFPNEKTLREAATANFITQNTQVPVARVLFHGLSNPDSEVGPFIVIQHVENCGTMSHALMMPNERDPTEAHMLNPGISEDVLESFYNKGAVHFLQLLEPSFPRRLSTFGFIEDDWSAQSKNQTTTLSPAPSGFSSFRLWCDVLRAGNILLNEANDIVAIVDWEFAYIAPTQFALDPPWWLLLNVPEMWHTNIDDWTKIYDVRLKTWLRAVEKAEESAKTKSNRFKVSIYMQESWETGRFWLNYAARKSWAFDTIFWKYLDERFFGSREGDIAKQDLWKTRVHLLSERERSAMESFVERKMEESKDRILVDWDDEQVKVRLAEVLFED
ncbi:hypothetical protein B7463_g5620, partial [Scytalidium lignicola]